MRNHLLLTICFFAFLIVAVLHAAEDSTKSTKVKFVTHRVGTFRSEACGVGDFNNDGNLDIVAGIYLYLGPKWKAVKIRNIKGEIDDQGKGYNWDFMNEPLDVDGDGLLDVVSCSWHGKRCEWYKNPGKKSGLWECYLVEENGNFEHGELWDIDNDNLRNEIIPSVLGTIWYELDRDSDGKQKLIKHVVSDKTFDWGVGAGDVNGDGRIDMLRPGAWFEAPADPRKGVWKEHSLAIGNIEEGKDEHTPQIFVYDVNSDGLNDIITSSAHKWGIFWYEQIKDKSKAELQWKQHIIDKSWTQAHALKLADIDNDGDLDLVTGKRFMAHNGLDPEGNKPLGVYWYELTRGVSPTWTKHVISFDEGIGAGLNIPVVDLDKDGDLDIIVTGKWGGPVWFENTIKKNK